MIEAFSCHRFFYYLYGFLNHMLELLDVQYGLLESLNVYFVRPWIKAFAINIPLSCFLYVNFENEYIYKIYFVIFVCIAPSSILRHRSLWIVLWLPIFIVKYFWCLNQLDDTFSMIFCAVHNRLYNIVEWI